MVASFEKDMSLIRPLLSRVRWILGRGTFKLSQNLSRTNFLCRVRDRFVTSRGGITETGVS